MLYIPIQLHERSLDEDRLFFPKQLIIYQDVSGSGHMIMDQGLVRLLTYNSRLVQDGSKCFKITS